MPLRNSFIVIAVCLVGCAQPAPHGEAAGPRSAGEAPAAPTAPQPVQERAEPSAKGPELCLPVAACNMFVGCARVEQENDPGRPGELRYRVLAYEHHPHQVGSHFRRSQVCWPRQGDRAEGCADALLYDNVPCTPVPPQQMALEYRCDGATGCTKQN